MSGMRKRHISTIFATSRGGTLCVSQSVAFTNGFSRGSERSTGVDRPRGGIRVAPGASTGVGEAALIPTSKWIQNAHPGE